MTVLMSLTITSCAGMMQHTNVDPLADLTGCTMTHILSLVMYG